MPREHGPDPRQAALAAARDSLARAGALSAFLSQSQQALATQLESARAPLQTGQADCTVLDAALARLGEFKAAQDNWNRSVVTLNGSVGNLELNYRKLAEFGRDFGPRASTICGYAHRAAATPAKQVQTWKADANQTLHQMTVQLEGIRKEVDSGVADVREQRTAVVASLREMNAFDGMTLALPLIPEAQEAQAQVRAALAKTDATARDMATAVAQIKQLAQQIEAGLAPYAGDDEANRILDDAHQLAGRLTDPDAELRAARSRVLGSSAPSFVSRNFTNYAALEQALAGVNMDKAVALSKESVQDADAVQTVGEAKAAPAYQALKQALECYAKIQGGTPAPAPAPPPPAPKPSPVDLRQLDLSGTWRFSNATLTLNGRADAAIGGTYVRPSDNCKHELKLRLKTMQPNGQLLLEGTFVDVKGFCCGNQGLWEFHVIDKDTIEGRAAWWKDSSPRPANLDWTGWVTARRQK